MTKTRIALLALTALLALPSASLAHRPKAETVDVAGLERKATVLRDTFGVPHVFAKSEHDAYFMVGYLHAQDRLVPDGFEPPAGERHARRAARLERARERRPAADARSSPRRGALDGGDFAREPRDPRGLRGRRERLARGEPAPLRVRRARADEGQRALVDGARLAGGLEADFARPLVRDQRHHEHAAADRLPDRRRRGRLRRTEAVLRGRDAQRAVRARALDPARRDLWVGEEARQVGLVVLLAGA